MKLTLGNSADEDVAKKPIELYVIDKCSTLNCNKVKLTDVTKSTHDEEDELAIHEVDLTPWPLINVEIHRFGVKWTDNDEEDLELDHFTLELCDAGNVCDKYELAKLNSITLDGSSCTSTSVCDELSVDLISLEMYKWI